MHPINIPLMRNLLNAESFNKIVIINICSPRLDFHLPFLFYYLIYEIEAVFMESKIKKNFREVTKNLRKCHNEPEAISCIRQGLNNVDGSLNHSSRKIAKYFFGPAFIFFYRRSIAAMTIYNSVFLFKRYSSKFLTSRVDAKVIYENLIPSCFNKWNVCAAYFRELQRRMIKE